MEKSDVKALFKKNWRVALEVAFFDQEKLTHTEILDPNSDQVNSKYEAFCTKLKIKNRPWVIVIDDKYASLNSVGSYNPLNNSISLDRSIYEGVAPIDNYILAHELGHGKDAMTRREFLQNSIVLGKGMITGVILGKLTDVSTKKLGVTDPYFRDGLGIYAGFSGGLDAVKNALKQQKRGREFKADEYAVFLLGYRDSIQAIYSCLPEESKQEISILKAEISNDLLTECVAKGIQPSDEELDFLCLVHALRKMPQREVSLSDIMKDGAYPTYLERIQRFAEQMQAEENER